MFELSDFYHYCQEHDVDVIPLGSTRFINTQMQNIWVFILCFPTSFIISKLSLIYFIFTRF